MKKAEEFYREKCNLPVDEILTLSADDLRIIQLIAEFAEKQIKELKNLNQDEV